MFTCTNCGTLDYREVQFNSVQTVTYVYNVIDWDEDDGYTYARLGPGEPSGDSDIDDEYWDCKKCYRRVEPIARYFPEVEY